MPPSLLGTAGPWGSRSPRRRALQATQGCPHKTPLSRSRPQSPTHPLGDDALDEGGGGDIEGWVPYANVSRNLLALEVRDLQQWASRAHGTRPSRAPARGMQWRCSPAPQACRLACGMLR